MSGAVRCCPNTVRLSPMTVTSLKMVFATVRWPYLHECPRTCWAAGDWQPASLILSFIFLVLAGSSCRNTASLCPPHLRSIPMPGLPLPLTSHPTPPTHLSAFQGRCVLRTHSLPFPSPYPVSRFVSLDCTWRVASRIPFARHLLNLLDAHSSRPKFGIIGIAFKLPGVESREISGLDSFA